MEASNVDWRKLRKPLMDKIGFLFSSGMFVDVTLNVTDGKTKKTFQAHSVFLKMASPVFEKMFESEFVEKSHVVDIDEVDPEVFGIFLKFLYFDNVDLQSYDEASEVLKVADRFLVEPLKDLCSSFMIPKLTATNALHAHSIGDIYHVDDLKEKAHQIMIAKTKEVLSSEDFNKADEKLVLSLLDEPILDIKEFELFKLVEVWLNKRPDKGELINAIVPKFHFFGMSGDEFAAGPSQSDMLTCEQKLAILQNLTTKIETPLPYGFTKTLRSQPIQCSNFKNQLVRSQKASDFFVSFLQIDQKVRIKKVGFTSCKCSEMHPIEFLMVVSSDEEVGRVRKVVKGVDIELDNPITLTPGINYKIHIEVDHYCFYEIVNFNNGYLSQNGIHFNFNKPLKMLGDPVLPLHSIYYTK